MSRALSIARATVPEPLEPEYLALTAELAARREARGQHFWIFRSAADPRRFVEFAESPSVAEHPARAALDPGERLLELELRRLATYEPDGGELWLEEPLAARRPIRPSA
ncbi:MAG: hypothetical protein ACOY71_06470 [Gemmatimonadota bacterium]